MSQIQITTPFAAPLIHGAKGGCFPADTQILTPTGSMRIEDCQVGDKVLCYTPDGEVLSRPIIETYTHGKQDLIQFVCGVKKVTLTPNHWVLKGTGQYDYAENFEKGDTLLDLKGDHHKILHIESVPSEIVYTLTVQDYSTFFAEGFRVHNKGGGKGGGSPAPAPTEEPNNLFSTDIVVATIALCEGPIYRVNPLGPQDLELNEGTVDDLINLDGDGQENTDVFRTISRTGTLTQSEMPVFGSRVTIPQQLASAVVLRKGNVPGIPRSAVTLQNTSVSDFSELVFSLQIQALSQMTDNGSIYNHGLGIRITVFNRAGTAIIGTRINKNFSNKTNTPYSFQLTYPIPKEERSKQGYKFTIEKISEDSDSSKISDIIGFQRWTEVKEERNAYPRTAAVGYALRAHNEHVGGVPTVTSVVKGLLCRVPSNYNQPILSNGEIDWREIELPYELNGWSYRENGYFLQYPGTGSKQTAAYPQIYKGLWDGNFVYAWTQNPVWIIMDMLTNTTYGIGIPIGNIDKWQFYKIAQYCDAVDPLSGKWYGVDGFSDGSYRHKPNGKFASVRETLLGINEGIPVKERRFILDMQLTDQQQAMDILNQICGTIRSILYYSGGRLSLQIDMPDEVPVMVFNETNIKPDTMAASGISESEIITGIDINYINPANHYKRETMRVDDPTSVDELNQIENVSSIDLPGVTRRSQAMRYAQYLIAASKYIRRKIGFETDTSAINITPGDLIAVQQKVIGTAWGFGGRISSNGALVAAGSRHTGPHANVTLEHFTSPGITSSTFTANTLPVGLRVFSNRNEDLRLYILSNTSFTTTTTGVNAAGEANVASGSDSITVRALEEYDLKTKTWDASFAWDANTVPARGDAWTLGEVNPNNFYRDTTDKLFKVTSLERDEAEGIKITASEYIANVYVDSDTAINYTPVRYTDTFSPLVPPPTPEFTITVNPVSNPDGSVQTDLEISDYSNISGYPIATKSIYEYAVPTGFAGIKKVIP